MTNPRQCLHQSPIYLLLLLSSLFFVHGHQHPSTLARLTLQNPNKVKTNYLGSITFTSPMTWPFRPVITRLSAFFVGQKTMTCRKRLCLMGKSIWYDLGLTYFGQPDSYVPWHGLRKSSYSKPSLRQETSLGATKGRVTGRFDQTGCILVGITLPGIENFNGAYHHHQLVY